MFLLKYFSDSHKSNVFVGCNINFIDNPSDNEINKLKMGYGACSVPGCSCQGYKDSYGSELCANCGHKYTDHW